MQATVRVVKGPEYEHPEVVAAELRNGFLILDVGNGTTVGYGLVNVVRYKLTGVPAQPEQSADAIITDVTDVEETDVEVTTESARAGSLREALREGAEGGSDV